MECGNLQSKQWESILETIVSLQSKQHRRLTALRLNEFGNHLLTEHHKLMTTERWRTSALDMILGFCSANGCVLRVEMTRVPHDVVKQTIPQLLTTAIGLQLKLEKWKEGDEYTALFYSVVFLIVDADENNEDEMRVADLVQPVEWCLEETISLRTQ
jgi:hypothetical protein